MSHWSWLLWGLLLCPSLALCFDHSPWDQLLQRHVKPYGKSTAVDYAGMQNQQATLKNYLNQLSGVKPAQFNSWPEPERLAFLINAYNAWTVDLILTRYPDLKSIKDLGGGLRSPWKKQFVPLLGKTRSLDDIEHHLIRENFNEPRIHFAVNCASKSCPPLGARAYTAQKLENQLQQQTKKFLSNRRDNRLQNGELYLSPIFKWYQQDFEKPWRGGDSLAQFLLKYADSLQLSASDRQRLAKQRLTIRYLDYDWSLNSLANARKGK